MKLPDYARGYPPGIILPDPPKPTQKNARHPFVIAVEAHWGIPSGDFIKQISKLLSTYTQPGPKPKTISPLGYNFRSVVIERPVRSFGDDYKPPFLAPFSTNTSPEAQARLAVDRHETAMAVDKVAGEGSSDIVFIHHHWLTDIITHHPMEMEAEIELARERIGEPDMWIVMTDHMTEAFHKRANQVAEDNCGASDRFDAFTLGGRLAAYRYAALHCLRAPRVLIDRGRVFAFHRCSYIGPAFKEHETEGAGGLIECAAADCIKATIELTHPTPTQASQDNVQG